MVDHYPAAERTKAITMVIHGLNLKPAAMLAFIHWLNRRGSAVYLVKLSGHFEHSLPISKVTSATWKEEVLAGYAVARLASIRHAVPLYFLGYSLGALLGQTMMTLSNGGISFEKQVLIAPAIALRRRCNLLKLLFFLPGIQQLPSYSPKEYKANASLPLLVYKILFAHLHALHRSGFRASNIPTLVFIDPKDELISIRKLQSCVTAFQLTQHTIILLGSDRQGRKGTFHHQILDEATMGPENWALVTGAMDTFLFSQG